MAAELQRDASIRERTGRVDLRLPIRHRHPRASPREQFRRRHSASRGTHHHHSLSGYRERHSTRRTRRTCDLIDLIDPLDLAHLDPFHLSFNVVRLSSAKMIPTITNRVITFGSLHPISSKW